MHSEPSANSIHPCQAMPIAHSSFASLYYKRGQSFKSKALYGKQAFPHPGYAWAWTRVALDAVGGLFELGGMDSGDHHMALG